LALLDGKTDKLSEKAEEAEVKVWRIKERYQSNPGNRPLFQAKKEGLLIIDELINYKFSFTLRHFFRDFKQIKTEAEKNDPRKLLF